MVASGLPAMSGSRPLSPKKQTNIGHRSASETGQDKAHVPQQSATYSMTSSPMLSSPDEGLRRQLEFGRLLDRQIAPLRIRSMYPAAWRNSSARSSP